jgi:CHAT domain-containing protein
LGPLSRQLGERIFLLPSGSLNGFPFDALRLDGKYLAEGHQLIHIESLSSVAAALAPLAADYGERVFLAGNPRSGRDLFSYGVSTSEEISAVRDGFVGDGLHIVQGVALRGDEFDDERYRNAALVHLAMPGRVDLAYPERSRLLLSGERETPTTEFLSPADLRAIGLKAQLAVLSGTAFTARPKSDFDSRLGLVNDLQSAGARQVLASLWPTGDTETAAFMAEFYQRLEADRNVSEALFQTRKARIKTGNGEKLRSWAGFQLFIR